MKRPNHKRENNANIKFYSRPEPHKRLRRFLSPAFTTKYIDGLGYLFEECMGTMIEVYERSFSAEKALRQAQTLETDLMEDLHNVALDM